MATSLVQAQGKDEEIRSRLLELVGPAFNGEFSKLFAAVLLDRIWDAYRPKKQRPAFEKALDEHPELLPSLQDAWRNKSFRPVRDLRTFSCQAHLLPSLNVFSRSLLEPTKETKEGVAVCDCLSRPV